MLLRFHRRRRRVAHVSPLIANRVFRRYHYVAVRCERNRPFELNLPVERRKKTYEPSILCWVCAFVPYRIRSVYVARWAWQRWRNNLVRLARRRRRQCSRTKPDNLRMSYNIIVHKMYIHPNKQSFTYCYSTSAHSHVYNDSNRIKPKRCFAGERISLHDYLCCVLYLINFN